MLDLVLSFKGEVRKVNNKIVEYHLSLIAHNGSGFESYVVLNNLPQWRSVVNLFKKGAGIVSLKIFNDHVDQSKKNPLYVNFGCGRVHIAKSFKKVGEIINYKNVYLKKN